MASEPVRVDFDTKQLRRDLKTFTDGLDGALKKANREAAEMVANAAKPKVPVRSGRAAASVRASATGKSAIVRAGNAATPYFPWLDFGGAVGRSKATVRPFLRGGRYLYPALEEKRHEVLSRYADEVARLAGAVTDAKAEFKRQLEADLEAVAREEGAGRRVVVPPIGSAPRRRGARG